MRRARSWNCSHVELRIVPFKLRFDGCESLVAQHSDNPYQPPQHSKISCGPRASLLSRSDTTDEPLKLAAVDLGSAERTQLQRCRAEEVRRNAGSATPSPGRVEAKAHHALRSSCQRSTT